LVRGLVNSAQRDFSRTRKAVASYRSKQLTSRFLSGRRFFARFSWRPFYKPLPGALQAN
jgi:hypothetical protein